STARAPAPPAGPRLVARDDRHWPDERRESEQQCEVGHVVHQAVDDDVLSGVRLSEYEEDEHQVAESGAVRQDERAQRGPFQSTIKHRLDPPEDEQRRGKHQHPEGDGVHEAENVEGVAKWVHRQRCSSQSDDAYCSASADTSSSSSWNEPGDAGVQSNTRARRSMKDSPKLSQSSSAAGSRAMEPWSNRPRLPRLRAAPASFAPSLTRTTSYSSGRRKQTPAPAHASSASDASHRCFSSASHPCSRSASARAVCTTR